MRKHLTYANVTATMALVFAMSGGALAARHYLITSEKQIKPSVLKQLRGKTGATGAKGLPGSAGPAGTPGPGAAFIRETIAMGKWDVRVAALDTGAEVLGSCAEGKVTLTIEGGGVDFRGFGTVTTDGGAVVPVEMDGGWPYRIEASGKTEVAFDGVVGIVTAASGGDVDVRGSFGAEACEFSGVVFPAR